GGKPEKGGEIVLRDDQAHALGRIVESLDRRETAAFLLHGMTGSGKTEVYLQAAQAAPDRVRSAILLVPEIALVPALAQTAERWFGGELAILHSGLGT